MARKTEVLDDIGHICVMFIATGAVAYQGRDLDQAATALVPGTTYFVSEINRRAALIGARRRVLKFRKGLRN